ncbi:DUF4352 domain-containing protein [Lysinibacillus sp. NPDC097287]|uniref:DUF4352 domain-containing protein n=1 Tax=Lysinibacillus sp. NPDC097287 TaxID=3364144 RepID=UPI003830F444
MTNAPMSKEELKQAKKDAKALLKKPFYKKWWVWLIAVILLFAMFGGGEDTPETADKADTPKAETGSAPDADGKVETSAEPKKEETKEQAKVPGIGEVINVGDVEFTVNGTSTAKNVGGQFGSNATGTYLLVDVTVKNVGNESITTDASFFKLKAGEKTYDADSGASISADSELKFFLQQVNPDLSNTGTVVFDVSDELIANPDLMLQVQTGFFGTETGTIKIGQ